MALDVYGLLIRGAVYPGDQRLGDGAERPEADRVEAHLVAVAAADAPGVVVELAARDGQGGAQRVEQRRPAAGEVAGAAEQRRLGRGLLLGLPLRPVLGLRRRRGRRRAALRLALGLGLLGVRLQQVDQVLLHASVPADVPGRAEVVAVVVGRVVDWVHGGQLLVEIGPKQRLVRGA